MNYPAQIIRPSTLQAHLAPFSVTVFFLIRDYAAMTTTKFLVALAALATPLAVKAQQNPQPPQLPPATTAQIQPTPCAKQAPPPPHKPGWLEKKATAMACKQNKNLCDLPSSVPDVTGQTPDAKPCPANTASNAPAPPKTNAAPAKPPVPASPAAAAASNGKPVYVCPPKSTLIPNFPYCLMPDHSVVDAIPFASEFISAGSASFCGSGHRAALTRLGAARESSPLRIDFTQRGGTER